MGQPVGDHCAIHGRGVADLLDDLVAALPQVSEAGASSGGPRRAALVGKPNVGKSSLLNKLAGDQRSVVHDVATTVDPVDSLIDSVTGCGGSSIPPASQGGTGEWPRVLRIGGAHAQRDRRRRGGDRVDRRVAADHRTGPVRRW